ncbi:MAG: hypothetical protein BJ554DRAFT_3150, partial [Olpidium bornovanus]
GHALFSRVPASGLSGDPLYHLSPGEFDQRLQLQSQQDAFMRQQQHQQQQQRVLAQQQLRQPSPSISDPSTTRSSILPSTNSPWGVRSPAMMEVPMPAGGNAHTPWSSHGGPFSNVLEGAPPVRGEAPQQGRSSCPAELVCEAPVSDKALKKPVRTAEAEVASRGSVDQLKGKLGGIPVGAANGETAADAEAKPVTSKLEERRPDKKKVPRKVSVPETNSGVGRAAEVPASGEEQQKQLSPKRPVQTAASAEKGKTAAAARGEQKKAAAAPTAPAAPAPPKPSAWGTRDDDARAPTNAPSLREIQEAEIKVAEAARLQMAKGNANRPAAAEVWRPLESGTGARAQAEKTPAWQAAPTAKKSLRQIQQEEEEKQRAKAAKREQLAEATGSLGGPQPPSRRYAEMAANSGAGPTTAAGAARRGVSAASAQSTTAGESAWVTVGAKGANQAAKPPPPPPPSAANAWKVASAASPQESKRPESPGSRGPSAEFLAWCRHNLRSVTGANGTCRAIEKTSYPLDAGLLFRFPS